MGRVGARFINSNFHRFDIIVAFELPNPPACALGDETRRDSCSRSLASRSLRVEVGACGDAITVSAADASDTRPLSLPRRKRRSSGLATGSLFAGRYRIERLLGRGGQADVYVAEQLSTDARIALKILRRDQFCPRDAAAHFELEARVAGRVRSDFIVRALDAGVDPGSGAPYLALELLEGESLAERVRRLGPLELSEVAERLAETALGLDRAHAHRGRDGRAAPIVHCDLKPENLFLARREGGGTQLKILDYGIARIANEPASSVGPVEGTPLYIAHEQLTGGVVRCETDVWPLGLIAFHALTAHSYWRAARVRPLDPSRIFAEILSLPLDGPSLRCRELGLAPPFPDGFDGWFLRCLERDPGRRFPTAGAAASAFQRLFELATT